MENSLWDLEEFEVVYEGKEFHISRLDLDVSDDFGKPEGTMVLSHEIEGFDETLYLIVDQVEESFTVGVRLGDTGLVTSIHTDEDFQKAIKFVMYINSLEEE